LIKGNKVQAGQNLQRSAIAFVIAIAAGLLTALIALLPVIAAVQLLTRTGATLAHVATCGTIEQQITAEGASTSLPTAHA
jgi:hypothetical protein